MFGVLSSVYIIFFYSIEGGGMSFHEHGLIVKFEIIIGPLIKSNQMDLV